MNYIVGVQATLMTFLPVSYFLLEKKRKKMHDFFPAF